MKSFLIILTVLIISVGCDNSSQTLMSVLNQSEFSQAEKDDLVQLVEFFESQISVDGKSRKESYEIMLTEAYNQYEAISNKIPITKQRDLLATITPSTSKELWKETDSRAFVLHSGEKLEKPIEYRSTVPVLDGKYTRLLDKIGKNEPKVKFYLIALQEAGDFPMYYHLYGFFVDHKANWTVDLNDSKWRIIVAIHFLSVNENQNRYMSLSKSEYLEKPIRLTTC